MRRISSIREVADVKLELPAGVDPYEDFDFEPYGEEARNEEELRATWRVFTKVKDVLDNGRRLENISWRLWFKQRQKGVTAPFAFLPHSSHPIPPSAVSVSTASNAAVSTPRFSSIASHHMPAPIPVPSLTLPTAAATTTTPVVTTTSPFFDHSSDPTSRPIPGASAPSANPLSETHRDIQYDLAQPVVHAHSPTSSMITPAIIDESSLSTLQQYGTNLDANLRRAEEETDRIVDDMFGGVGQRFQKESARLIQREKAERTRALLELGVKHSLSDAVLDDILKWARLHVMHDDVTGHAAHLSHPTPSVTSVTSTATPTTPVAMSPPSPPHSLGPLDTATTDDFLPTSISDGRAFVERTRYAPRPHAGAFCHSLERNGANNFLLYLIRELRDDIHFEVVSPKEGIMRTEYETLGVSVTVCPMKSPTYHEDLMNIMSRLKYAIANTIMMTEVVNAAGEKQVPCLWVIHEAWPRGQFDYYAKDVFMTPHVDERTILKAFRNAKQIAFPAKVQRRCYQGLFDEKVCRVIYNGIPLASINAFRTMQSRDLVRAELGIGKDDLLLLHMGSVCRRKGQLLTCQVFADLYASQVRPLGRNLRLLLVGARYIRQHEIDYIDECRQTLEAADAIESGAARIVDVTKHVLGYYLAADIVLCPSVNEVLPLVICEAMAFERPVIASKIDGIPEAMDHGAEGLLIEAGNEAQLYDAVVHLASNDDLRAKMGAAGRKRVLKQFSFDTMSRTYRDTIGKHLELGPPHNNGHP